MKILVQKYGGTSVATMESREMVYQKILNAKEEGYGVVVVISAMGRSGAPYATDTLLDLIRLDCNAADKRELDLVFSCGEIISGALITSNLQQKGHNAVFLTGQQAGIITTPDFGDARILQVNTAYIKKRLSESNIVVVAGGQGATADGQITSLGRGGSDTTACALGMALDAEEIEIYTDVQGIFTVDPRVVPEARPLEEISYEDCCLMAYQGAKVMHPRAVEIASQKPNIKLFVKSVFDSDPGTLIRSIRYKLPYGADLPAKEGPVGIALMNRQSIYKAENLHRGQKADILKELKGLNAQIQDIHPEVNQLLLVMEESDSAIVENVLSSMDIAGKLFRGLNKISMIGEGLSASPEVFAAFISAVEEIGITVISATMQANVFSLWVEDSFKEAAREVHKLIQETVGININTA